MPKNPRNLFLRGNTWYYNFYLQGERFQGRIGQVSKTVAKEKLIRIKAQAYEGKFMPGKTRDESFSKVLDEYLAYCKDHQKKSTPGPPFTGKSSQTRFRCVTAIPDNSFSNREIQA